MPTDYTASIRVKDGNLTVTRPHPAPTAVDELVDDLLYRIRDGEAGIVAAEVMVEYDEGPQPGEEPDEAAQEPSAGSNLPPVPPTPLDPLPGRTDLPPAAP